ncbi:MULTISPECIES: hypothetical protein [Undibacterium]|jgi:hypothetical protein|uniref:Uncharacterized protein n=2 Tax=Undibacterium TaxID=401469 RepID=A0A941I363_9BURK|nr:MULTISPECIES: hypothetical protein [Undibacterium]MBR7745714.1 hypothetical protein [Undibacterium baiyunense]
MSLASYERDEVTRDDFVQFLSSSILALEGVPDSVRHELRNYQKEIEIEGYLEDEEFEANTIEVKESLAIWLKSLKLKYCGGNC